jgi:Flp pilus assembly protein TadD
VKSPRVLLLVAGTVGYLCIFLPMAGPEADAQKNETGQEKEFAESPICKVGGTLQEGWYIFAEDSSDNWRLSCPRPTTLDDPHYNVWRTTPALDHVAEACRDTPLPKGFVIVEELFRGECPSAGVTMLGELAPNAYRLRREAAESPEGTPLSETDRHSEGIASQNPPRTVPFAKTALQHAALGNEYFTRLQFAEAEQQFRRAGELDPVSADWPALVALTLLLQEKYDEAETEAQIAVRLDQKNAVAHAALAAALSSLGKWKDAELESRVGMRLDPTGARGIPGLSQFTLGLSLWRLGKKEEAEQALRDIAQKFDRYQGKLAQLLFEDARLDEAETQYRQALGLHPGDPFLSKGLDEVLKAQKDRQFAGPRSP